MQHSSSTAADQLGCGGRQGAAPLRPLSVNSAPPVAAMFVDIRPGVGGPGGGRGPSTASPEGPPRPPGDPRCWAEPYQWRGWPAAAHGDKKLCLLFLPTLPSCRAPCVGLGEVCRLSGGARAVGRCEGCRQVRLLALG